MRKLIIIDDELVERYNILRYLYAAHFKKKKELPYQGQEIRTVLEKAGFHIEEYSGNEEVLKKFKKGFSDEMVIILDGNVKDGKTDKLFHLFSDKIKKVTFIYSGDFSFNKKASENNFVNFLPKGTMPIKIQEFQKLGEPILKALVG